MKVSYDRGFWTRATRMLCPAKDGGLIIAHTAPGCWEPMITPCIRMLIVQFIWNKLAEKAGEAESLSLSRFILIWTNTYHSFHTNMEK